MPTMPPAGKSPVPTRIGPYEIERMLGQGGMGAVYLALHPELRRHVALKLLPHDADAEEVERFKREARAAARLRHKGIVPVHDVGEDGGRHYFTMDYLTGGALHDLLKKGRLPVRRCFEIMRRIVEALDYAHRQGVTHRDLKPQNIMLDEAGEPLISDFGLARLSDDVSLSRSGQMFGTPSYMAPEAARGDNRLVDARSDIWSAGACLYQMLSGQLPFAGSSVVDVLIRIAQVDPSPLRAVQRGFPRDAEAIVFKCMAKEQEARYQSARELAQDIDRFLDGLPVVARPVTWLRRAASWVRRNRALTTTAALGVLGIAATLAWTIWVGPVLSTAARRKRLDALERDTADAARRESGRLLAAIEAGAVDPAIREAKDVPARLRQRAGVKDADEMAAVERGIAVYRSGPILSRAHFLKGEMPLAYRHDPAGRWGLKAQIAIAGKFVENLRLADASVVLNRIRSRFPDSEAAKDALAVLGDVFAHQGKQEEALAAYLEVGTQPDRVAILEALLGERAVIPVPPVVAPAWYGIAHETSPILDLGEPLLVLPWRQGRPAYRLVRDGLVAAPSPLAALDPTDEVADLCDADLDGDGHREVLVALSRGGQGAGYAVLDREGESWKVRHIDLSNSAPATLIAAGDLDGDGRDEAIVCFMWRSPHQWIVQWRDKPTVLKFNPGGARPWVLSLVIADIDGDGRREAVLARSGQIEQHIEFWEMREGKFGITGRHVVGAAGAMEPLGDGLLAVAAGIDLDYARPELLRKLGPDSGNQLAFCLLRRKGGALTELAWHAWRTTVGDNSEIGRIAAGRLAGRPAIVFNTYRGATDPMRTKAEGHRLRVILGDPTSAPRAFGVPWNIQSFLLRDFDGDGESELLVLDSDKARILGRRRGPPPKLPPVDAEPPPASEAAALLGAANDLLGFESFDAARDLLAEIVERFPGTPEESEARRLRVDTLLRDARLRRATSAAPETVRTPVNVELHRQAVERCRQAAVEARTAAAAVERPEMKRRLLLLASEASRLALDLAGMRDDLAAAIRHAPATDDLRASETIKALEGALTMETVLDGNLAADALPFVTDAPTRARRDRDAIEIALDGHSERLVAGVPVHYVSGALELSFDLELQSSVWSAVAAFGLLGLEGPAEASVRMFLHGVAPWDRQGALFSTRGLDAHVHGYRGLWKISLVYSPEAALHSLEIRDASGATVFAGHTAASALPRGQYVFGASVWYEPSDVLLSHQQHPATTMMRLSNWRLRAAKASLDRASLPGPRGLELMAGARLFRGDRKGAVQLYQQALERDSRLIRARVHLALAADDPAPLAEAFRIDPYEAVCAIDDAARGTRADARLALGSLVRRLRGRSDGIVRAACASLMGDYEEAFAELKPLPVTPARQYIVHRSPWYGENAWDWLQARGIRGPGNELPPLVWTPEPDDTLDSLRRALAEAKRADSAWVLAGRALLLAPDDVALLQARANAASRFGMQGPVEIDYLRIAELLPKDPNAQLLTALLYASRRSTRLTMEFLGRAVAAGLRDAASLDREEFAFLREHAPFVELRKRMATE